ncbi:hypothetical protein V7S43_014777 [Phytophthora oleae]|uniref:Elicitin-like protein n=1 Tax=Phytophthora oleae TaxID=2107226 RepID=A0ABD3F0K0_9STRA
MKNPFGVILVLSAAGAYDEAAAAAPACNTTALSQLLMNSQVRTCRSDSGYNPASLGPATDAQVTAVCNSNDCTQAINAVKQVAPNECTIGPVRLYADVIHPLEKRCGRGSGSASAAGSAGVAGNGSVSGPGSGATVGSASAPGSVAGSAGSTVKPPVTSKPRTASPHSDSPSTSPGNRGHEAPTLSTFAAIAVLATVVAAIL